MTTTKMTLASVLGVVTVAANAATTALNTASNGIAMLDDTVSKMRTEQKREHQIDLAVHALQYKLNADKSHGEFLMKINEFRAKSQMHEQMYDLATSQLDAEILRQASPTT